MIVIVHHNDGSWQRFYDVAEIVTKPGWVYLQKGKDMVKQLCASTCRLEVWP